MNVKNGSAGIGLNEAMGSARGLDLYSKFVVDGYYPCTGRRFHGSRICMPRKDWMGRLG